MNAADGNWEHGFQKGEKLLLRGSHPVPEEPAFWEAQVSPAEAAGLSTQMRELRAAHAICSLLFGACAHPFPWGLA